MFAVHVFAVMFPFFRSVLCFFPTFFVHQQLAHPRTRIPAKHTNRFLHLCPFMPCSFLSPSPHSLRSLVLFLSVSFFFLTHLCLKRAVVLARFFEWRFREWDPCGRFRSALAEPPCLPLLLLSASCHCRPDPVCVVRSQTGAARAKCQAPSCCLHLPQWPAQCPSPCPTLNHAAHPLTADSPRPHLRVSDATDQKKQSKKKRKLSQNGNPVRDPAIQSSPPPNNPTHSTPPEPQHFLRAIRYTGTG